MSQIIKLSDNAASRIKEIMSNAQKESIGVRVSVKSGGCAGMSYVMEYSNEINPNDEVIEELKWTIKKRIFPHLLCLIILMRLKDAVVESRLR